MKTNFRKVYDFNTCFNHKVCDEPYLNVFTEEPKLVQLRLDLIKEEINELEEAHKNTDLIEIIDALSDILYVAYGLGVCFGIDLDKTFLKNISKSVTPDMKLDEETMKQMTNYQLTNRIIFDNRTGELKSYHENIKSKLIVFKANFDAILNYIRKVYDKLENDCKEQNFENVEYNTYNLIRLTYSLGIHIGVDLDASFKIVHDSNMTKICDTEELAKATVEHYKQNDDRYDSPAYKHSQYGYIIYNESTGKILKSIKYTAANFESLLKF